MEIENLRKIIIEGNIHEKYAISEELESQFITLEIFENLCCLLSDNDSKVRFLSLSCLINKFKPFLSKADKKLTDKIYDLIFDENGPVADRAVWAIGISGDIGLNKLIEEYQINSDLTRSKIVMAIGRSNFTHRIETRIEILLDAIKSKNEDLRYNAMCELMSNSPIGSWQKNQNTAIYFVKVYPKVLPVAKKFSESNSNKYSEFAKRYLDQLGN